MNAQRALAWGLPALAVLPRAAIALWDLHSAIAADLVQDDAFYYFAIARNALEGRGPSFDGQTPTNAFHPLFMALVLACVAALPSSLEAPVHAVNLGLALIAGVSTRLLFLLVRDWADQRAAVCAALLFAISPYFVVHTTNGLETGLALCLVLAVLRAYQCWIAPLDRLPSQRRAALFGVLCGLAVLARVDAALLLAALAIDRVWRQTRGHERAAELETRVRVRPLLARAALAVAMAGLVWLPWGLVSRAQTGAWLPTSGAASREIALQLGWSNLSPIWDARRATARTFEIPPSGGGANVPLAWWADVFTKQVAVLALEQPLLAPLRVTTPYGVWPPLSRWTPMRWLVAHPLATSAGLAAALAVALAALRRAFPATAEARPGASDLTRPILLLQLLLLLGYTFHAPTHWYFARYSVSIVLLTMALGLATLSLRAGASANANANANTGGHSGLFTAFATLVIVCQLGLGLAFAQRLRTATPERGFLVAWQRLAPHLPEHARVAAFQSGIYGWFGGRPIVNLDGKVNPDAQRALADNALHRYVAQSDIEYVLDWPLMLNALLLRHVPPSERAALRFEEIARERARGGVVLWRVERAAAAGVDGGTAPAGRARASP